MAGLAVAATYVLLLCRGRPFTVFDGMVTIGLMAAVTGLAIPLIEQADQRARQAALDQILHSLRSHIALYKAEHGGKPPVLLDGTLPQLLYATNAQGIPGPAGEHYPYGPYFRYGLPANPFTNVATVTATETFPPKAASGTGGWLYHEPTGQITADLEGFLDK
ncbi:MAG TPA: redox-sensing transcriptional repressor Rex [Planctomycetaceae bacterium]|nr:redox-sensing transcriptional repressor Rex [Planctomycetaceae bacterium]HIQ22900.1 redox-sensing transcriptional repressor Rex [Planctomycetota bacterium]